MEPQVRIIKLTDEDTVQVYKDDQGKFRWRRLAAETGEQLVASSEFDLRKEAVAAAEKLNPKIEIQILRDDPTRS